MRGVYIIKNLKKNRVYVGSSIDIRFRIEMHFWELGYGKHGNRQLQKDYLKDYRYFVWSPVITFPVTTDRMFIYYYEQKILDQQKGNCYNKLLSTIDHFKGIYGTNKMTKVKQLKLFY